MGTALLLHHILVPTFSYRTSTPIATSDIENRPTHLHLPRQNVLQQQPMKYLNLKSIASAASNPFRFKFNKPKLICAVNIYNSSSLTYTMADKSQSVSDNSTTLNGKKEEDEIFEKSKPRYIPPPPEKPLPDDCCGSGCVRCVWDIYYDELEAYNKLYKSNTDDSPNNSGASSKLS